MSKNSIYVGIFILFLFGCKSPENFKEINLNKYQYKSILVLPPLNKSVDVNASYIYLSFITKPLVELGYYVFPVAVIDTLMKQNGLPTSVEMHQIPLKKIEEIINPDAVLYIKIEEWGEKYKIIKSEIIIDISAKLVDTKTGKILWENRQNVVKNNVGTYGDQGLVSLLISAVVSQIINKITTSIYEIIDEINFKLFYNYSNAFPRGAYNY